MDQKREKTIHVSVIIPAFNEGKIIYKVVKQVNDILNAQDFEYEILLVDDGSEDNTSQEAERAGARVIKHAYNIGNGAAVKSGLREAKGTYVVMMDGDGQHDPEVIPDLLDLLNDYDMVVGARTRDSETRFLRDIANWVYNMFASYICSRKIPDLTSGFRALRTVVAKEFIYLLPNTFSYPTTITLAVARAGYQYTYYPIKTTRRVGSSKIKLINDGFRFLLILFKISTLFSPLKVFIPVSIIVFLTGFVYGLYKVLYLGLRYGPTSAMLMTISGVIFLIGLISEQVAQLRYERSSSVK